MKRFSVLYQFNEQYKHIWAATEEEAQVVINQILMDKRRTPIGVYDSKTELIDWVPAIQQVYKEASISEQGRKGERMILIAQALRRRDSNWHSLEGVNRPSFFA
ncbi:hypothetical protein GCM10028807_38310 [Spirosoma daeguense]